MKQNIRWGVLFVNLGTPDEPTAAAVRRYLAEFLHDKRVVDLSRWIWCPVLHGIILRVRPPKVAKLYQSIWTEQGSPLLVISQRQVEAVQQQLKGEGLEIRVALAMNYGSPSIAEGFKQLGTVDKLLVLPLYPQFSSATTASVMDRVSQYLKQQWNCPEVHYVRSYYDHPMYIEALANSVRQEWTLRSQPDVLLMSFHGIPQRYANLGDPYPQECEVTAQLLAEALGLSKDQWQLCYQSRFGREPWLQPYTDETLASLGSQGKSVDVICPGFAADCLETLEEIKEQNRETFLASGGSDYNYIPCLNDSSDHIQLLTQLVRNSCG
jgi:ferrochelatase